MLIEEVSSSGHEREPTFWFQHPRFGCNEELYALQHEFV
jgi:hypothetical protein